MAIRFDPYYIWLGIPSREQPPNHYRLLGVEPFESNPNVIQDAATERMNYLQVFTQGRQADLGRRLCQETVAAKECLLSPRRKAAYDSQLRMDLSQGAGRPHSTLPPPPPSDQRDPVPGEVPAQQQADGPRCNRAGRYGPDGDRPVALDDFRTRLRCPKIGRRSRRSKGVLKGRFGCPD